MLDLVNFHAKICFTSAAVLINQDKVLLILHKKLGIWLPPGGHCELDELPHQTAERECYEESGVRVEAVSAQLNPPGSVSQYLPNPFLTNLHWISEENYQSRLNSNHPTQRIKTDKWPNGCEQHLTFCYLVKPTGNIKLIQNVEETDGIGWFGFDQINNLKTTPDVKNELILAFQHQNPTLTSRN
jgi:8-oxo-dGTP pyrophosphatase MutT (NUDIX family)